MSVLKFVSFCQSGTPAPVLAVLHDNPPAEFVVSTWLFEPSADGKRYSIPRKVVDAETESVPVIAPPEVGR